MGGEKRNDLRKKEKKDPGRDVSAWLSFDHLAASVSVKPSRERSLYSGRANLFHYLGGGCRGATLAGEDKDREENPLLHLGGQTQVSPSQRKSLNYGEDDEQGGASIKQPLIGGAQLVFHRCSNTVYNGVEAVKYLQMFFFFPINYERVCCGQTALSFLHADITGITLTV